MGIGELSAIATAFCWSISASYFESCGKKIGSFNLNMTRLIFGLIFIMTYNFFVNGMVFPTDASIETIILMGISGFLGIFLGDLMLYEAFVLLSARITLLIFFAVPPLTSLISFLFLDDIMHINEVVGMIVILFGIYLVVSKKGTSESKGNISKKGLIFAIGATFLQALGNVFSKSAAVDYNPFLSAEIRLLAALLAFIALYTIKGHWKVYLETFKDIGVLKHIAIGSFFGPFLGIGLTLLSLQYLNAGISSTLSSISPIILIPYVAIIKKEKITKYDIIGTIVAFLGLIIIL